MDIHEVLGKIVEKYGVLKFKEMLPKNKNPFQGGCVLLDKDERIFYRIYFGDGSNLDADDIREGYDDYLMCDAFNCREDEDFERVLSFLKNKADESDIYAMDCNCDLETWADGGQLMVKRSEYDNCPFLYRYLPNALDMACYGCSDMTKFYDNLELVRVFN